MITHYDFGLVARTLVFGFTNQVMLGQTRLLSYREYGKCSKISNTLKLWTPKIIAENNF